MCHKSYFFDEDYEDKIQDLKHTSVKRLIHYVDNYIDSHDKYYDYLEKTFKNL